MLVSVGEGSKRHVGRNAIGILIGVAVVIPVDADAAERSSNKLLPYDADVGEKSTVPGKVAAKIGRPGTA